MSKLQAPDKIYLWHDPKYPTLDGIVDVWADHPVQDFDNHEYIRKEALIDILLTMEARYSVFYLEGKIVRELIDKINSL
jgi:hypothetical protein